MRIAVIGGGNGCLAAAADFALAGHEVRLWRRGAADVARHHGLGDRIVVRDVSGTREAQLSLVSDSMGPVVDGAELVLCPLPATTQEAVAPLLAPHLREGQVVYLPPGTLGTLVFAGAAHRGGTVHGVAFAEAGTLPWLVRKHGFASVAISVRATRLPTGIFPLVLQDHALTVLSRAFPGVVEPCGDVLSGALMNAGPIIHPPLILMNAAPLEHFPAWDIHNEGTQPAVRRVTDALDAERIAIREALGYGAPHFPLADHYRPDGGEWMYGRKSHERLTDSGDWREKIVLTEHRYMLEDVRLGLSLQASLATLAGVEAPLTSALLHLGSAVCGEDFATQGRPLSRVGLGGMSRDRIGAFLRDGFR